MKTTVASSAIRIESTIGSKLLALPDPITSDFRPLLTIIEPASISELWEAQKELQIERFALAMLSMTEDQLALSRYWRDEDRDYQGHTKYTDLSQEQVDKIEKRFLELKDKFPLDNLPTENLRIDRILYLTLCELFQKQSDSLDSGDHMRANHGTGALMDSIAESNKRRESSSCPVIEFFNGTSFIYLNSNSMSRELGVPGGWQWMSPRDVLTNPDARDKYAPLFEKIDRQILDLEIAQQAFDLRAKFIQECRV